ncbi:MAG: peptide-methionine (R)-S-oxide reductase MsrB [Campylobacterales bacterium]|nr:peptide-methionine (R)-S-oxide reductase MsrB [Campylobacterales bacterium]
MKKIHKTAQEWQEILPPETYYVAREHGTERPFSGALYNNKQKGIYRCACCGEALFTSESKFDSDTGWPSYFEPFNETCISEKRDHSHGMERVEVLCSVCDAHLGHVFPDGPRPTGLRYCINSVCLTFEASDA